MSLYNTECSSGKHSQAKTAFDGIVDVVEPPVHFDCALANALERGETEKFVEQVSGRGARSQPPTLTKVTAQVDHKTFDKLLVTLDTSAKPVLVVAANSGLLALAVALAFAATRHSTSLESAAQVLDNSTMREYIGGYAAAKYQRMMGRQGVRKYTDEIWGASQPSEEELKRWKAGESW